MIRILAAAMLLASAARAGEPEPDAARPVPSRTGVPSNGVDEAPRRGTFAEAGVGVFTTVGGSRRFSNAQPWLGLTFGRDVASAASIFASLGFGASSNSCFQSAQAGCLSVDSFGAAFLEAGGSYGMWVAPRLLLSGKVMGGLTLFSPGPFTQKDGTVPDRAIGPHAGVALALEYQTRLDHFVVGLDTAVRYSLPRRVQGAGEGGIASLAVVPGIRYVF
ncbi:MAG: adventurous gliding motility protein CglE [Myxococcales bacterium]